MEIQYLVAKIHLDGSPGMDPAKVVDVFHHWVASQSMPEMLVDVAELLHVPKGPGVIAVGTDCDYALDHSNEVWGVLYRRKTPANGTNADRIAQALQSAAHAGRLLESEFADALKISRTKFELIINDRALAPNTADTYAKAKPEIEAGLRALLAHGDFTLEAHDQEPRQRFGYTVTSAQPFDLAAVTA